MDHNGVWFSFGKWQLFSPTLLQMSGYVQGKICKSGKKTKGLVIDFKEAKHKKLLFDW